MHRQTDRQLTSQHVDPSSVPVAVEHNGGTENTGRADCTTRVASCSKQVQRQGNTNCHWSYVACRASNVQVQDGVRSTQHLQISAKCEEGCRGHGAWCSPKCYLLHACIRTDSAFEVLHHQMTDLPGRSRQEAQTTKSACNKVGQAHQEIAVCKA